MKLDRNLSFSIRVLFEGEINTGAGKTSQKLRPQKDLAEDSS